MARLFNMARMTTATAGTGTITLGSPVLPYLTFVAAGVVAGDVVSYTIKDGSNWEIGHGKIAGSPPYTMTRDVVASTNSNTPINLSGTAQVFIAANSDLQVNSMQRVNVKDFGAKGNSTTDDTAAIQAAIDFAYANNIATIYMPAGRYRTTDSLWLDPPGNARVPANFNNPSMYDFTMRLVGDGYGGGTAFGTYIYPEITTGAALYIGPGQAMGVKGIQIRGSNVSYRSELPDTTGMYILCSNGGAHITVLEDCQVTFFNIGYRVGGNKDSMGDSTTLLRCSASWCNIGFGVMSTQQLINAMRDCTFSECKTSVISYSNLPIQITGGNISVASGVASAFVVRASGGSIISSEFTDPDQGDWAHCRRFSVHVETVGYSDPAKVAPSDIFAVKTARWGIMPLLKYSWDAGTGILTLKLVKEWLEDYGRVDMGYLPLQSIVDALVAVSPVVYLYGGERVTTFGSIGIHAKGIHVENPNAFSRLAHLRGGWGVTDMMRLEDIELNWDASFAPFATFDEYSSWYALYILGQAWPYIEGTDGQSLQLNNVGPDNYSRGIVRLRHAPDKDGRLRDFIPGNIKAPVIINTPFDGTDINQYSFGGILETPGRGAGDFDRWVTFPKAETTGSIPDNLPHVNGISRSPFVGFYPAPWVTPRLTPVMLELLLGTLPALADADYGPICGDCIYQVSHFSELNPRDMFVKFHHMFWSWGQNLSSVGWSHEGKSLYIYFDNMDYIFPGLYFGLDHTSYGGGMEYYVVTEVHARQGYCLVLKAVNNQYRESYGDVGTIYSGTGVAQQPFAVTKIGKLSAAALSDSHIAGKRFYVGDQIWKSDPAGSGSMGWICTTAGIAGTDAVFKTMPVLGA